MSQNNSQSLSEEMEEKLSKLVEEGKITLEQKTLLLEAMEDESVKEGDTVEIGVILNMEERDLFIQFISEDIEIIGTNDSQISIIKGNQYVHVEKTTKSVKIQSKKDELGHFLSLGHTSDLIKIHVPLRMPVRIKTVSGDIDIQNMESPIEIKSVSGDIQIKKSQNQIEASTMSGDIKVSQTKGNCSLISKSGDVAIEDSELSGLVKSYSGDISISDAILTDLDISSFSGDVDLDKAELSNTIQVKTFSGDIQAKLQNQEGNFSGTSGAGELVLIDPEGTQHLLQNEPVEIGKSKLIMTIKTASGDATIKLKKS